MRPRDNSRRRHALNKHVWLLALALVFLTEVRPAHAESTTWFGFQVGISGGNAPPPVLFRSEPRVAVVSGVQVVEDDRCNEDVFRTEDTWWRLRGGYWYRSASWRGPWVYIDVRRVPERVLGVPAQHWKHHPRHENRSDLASREDERPHGRGRGHADRRDRGDD